MRKGKPTTVARAKDLVATAPAVLGGIGMQDDWRAQGDAETLMRAEEIKGDKGRHGAALAHMKKKHKELGRALGKGERAMDSGPGDMGAGYRVLR